MSGKRGQRSELATALPPKFTGGFAWDLDRRSIVGREVIHALGQLVQDLGGRESLSAQQRMLCERTVFLHHRLITHESAVLSGRESAMSVHEHVAATNALLGLLKNLGLKRQAKDLGTLQSYLEGSVGEPDEPDEAPEADALDAVDGVVDPLEAADGT